MTPRPAFTPNRTSIVYIVNAPSRAGSDGRVSIDLRPAERFGRLRYLTEPGDDHPRGDEVQDLIDELERGLAGFTQDDFLVPVGHPAIIGVACTIAAAASGGRVTMLRWNRTLRRYEPLLVDLARFIRPS
ncbi:MAG TPA: hypothetical protein VIW73_13150 [Candidatus Cybelea sp.]